MRKHIKLSQQGFTIAEALVASALFMIMTLMAVSAVITIMNANEQVKSVSMSAGHVDSIFQEMFRDVSEGTDYQNCPGLPGPWTVPASSGVTDSECESLSTDSSSSPRMAYLRSLYPNSLYCGRGGFRFMGKDNTIHAYRLSCGFGALEYSLGESSPDPVNYSGGWYNQLTTDSIDITGLRTRVVDDPSMPQAVYINMSGNLNLRKGKTSKFSVETMVTQRIDPTNL